MEEYKDAYDYYSGGFELRPIGLNRPRFQTDDHLKNNLIAGRGGSNIAIDLEVSNSNL